MQKQNLAAEIEAVHRELTNNELNGRPGLGLCLSRTFPVSRNHLWSVLTEAGHLAKWFLPVKGDLRQGGSFAFEGNAEGKILECVRLKSFAATWAYGGGPPTLVEVELADDPHGCRLRLTHTADAEMIKALIEQIGPEGTAGVGAGWDASLLQLALYLGGNRSPPTVDAEDAPPEMKRAMAKATEAWLTLLADSDWLGK